MSLTNCSKPTNREIAQFLGRIAELLEAQDANPFRVRAYRDAAAVVNHHHQTFAALADDLSALEALPKIGPNIARTIAEFVQCGHSSMLDRLEGERSIERQLCRIPGVGEKLASQIHAQLHVDSLEELEMAAHDGRLASLPGFGPKRTRAVINALDSQLRRRRDWGAGEPVGMQPPVAQLLKVDEIYRRKAAANELRLIAPRRFNPRREAWLPIMHLELEGWEFTALFSNTERAHQLGKTRDWVVIYFDNGQAQGQVTVVSELRGTLRGRRVVRGREEACLDHYRRRAPAGAEGTVGRRLRTSLPAPG